MHKIYDKSGLPEIIFSSIKDDSFRKIERLLNNGLIRKLTPKVYTSNLDEVDAVIIKRNLWSILSFRFPNAILSHRSAFEFKLSPKNTIYLTGNTRKVHHWAGIKIKMTKGTERLSDDTIVYENLFASSLERALLENLSSSRSEDGEKRTLSQEEIEKRLIQELNVNGEAGLNQLRDRAKLIAKKLKWDKQFRKLNNLISSILSSNSKDLLRSPVALATALGMPYDGGRMELFQKLIAALKNTPFENNSQKTKSAEAYSLISFYESYFSNYIEGTTFEVAEAKDIIFNNQTIPNRAGDSHDVLATYQVVNNRFEMNRIPNSFEDLTALLQARHLEILKVRTDKNPGKFKSKINRAGRSVFVTPEMVKGTLQQGFKLIGSLTKAIERALYLMFLISEIHPFDDGNGRIARIMMNAELVHAKQSKLIIPTVYRDDYILNLKKFSTQRTPNGYIKMMQRAFSFSHWLNPESAEMLEEQLESSNAFLESGEGALRF